MKRWAPDGDVATGWSEDWPLSEEVDSPERSTGCSTGEGWRREGWRGEGLVGYCRGEVTSAFGGGMAEDGVLMRVGMVWGRGEVTFIGRRCCGL